MITNKVISYLIYKQFIYNIKFEYNGLALKIEKIKWSDSISSILCLEKCDKKTFEVIVKYDSKINKTENQVENNKLFNFKTERTFSFKNMKDKGLFIFLMRKNYFNLKNSYLEIKQDYLCLFHFILFIYKILIKL